ncbi:MAG: RDD family protein [Bdellovibrionales bacterium]|nr:RDD family protein [Bdellovibrionales bacterium]
MVLSDPEAELPSAKQSISQLEWLGQLARPLDRAAAIVIDGIVLSTLVGLTTSRAQHGVELSRILNDLSQLRFEIWILALVSVLTLFLYQVIQWSLYGKTIGQRIVGIEVVNVFTGESPGLIESATRSLYWWPDLLLMLPNLGIFRDPLRRPFHDRVANTLVISRRRFGARPHRRERRGSELVTATIIATLTWVSLAILSPENRWIMSTMRSDAPDLSCELIDEVIEKLPEGQKMSQTEAALILYASGKVDVKCVDQESRKAARQNSKDPVMRFARSLANSSEAELSNEYLEKVCESAPDSDICRLAIAYDELSLGKTESAIARLRKVRPQAPMYISIFAAKQLEKLGQFEDVYRLMTEITPFPEIEDFVGQLSISALWGMARPSEARVLFQSTLSRFSNKESRVRFESWMCRLELDQACSGARALPCKKFHREILGDSTLLADESIGLTHLVHERCSKQSADRLGRLARFSGSIHLMDLTEAMSEKAPAQKHSKLLDMISDSKVPAPIRSQVFQILLKEDAISSLDEKVDLFWSVAQMSDWYWRSAGLVLADVLSKKAEPRTLTAFLSQWKTRSGLPESLRSLRSGVLMRAPASGSSPAQGQDE